MQEQVVKYDKTKVVSVMFGVLMISGAMFTILDLIVGENPWYIPLCLAAISGVGFLLNRKGTCQYCHFVVYLLFLFWISMLTFNQTDEEGVRVYFVIAFSIPHILFDRRLTRWAMGASAFGVFILLLWLQPMRPLPTSGMVAFYVAMHFLLCGFGMFLVLGYFRRQIDIAYSRQRKALSHSEKLVAELGEVNDELVEKQHQLIERNNSLRTFAYVASHDLKSPLRSIISFQKLIQMKLKESPDYPQVQEHIDYVIDSAGSLAKILDSLLEYTRAENKIETNLRHFSLIDMLDRIHREQCEVHDGSIEVKMQIGQDHINSDYELLYCILQNLISNGLKFNYSNTPKVWVKATSDEGVLTISVSDNGIGIDQKYLDQIFEPFNRLHGKSAFQGTGLGLAIVQRFVEVLGGEITVNSTLGEGTTFILRLPDPQLQPAPARSVAHV